MFGACCSGVSRIRILRVPAVKPEKDYSFLNILLLIAVSEYQLYFWFACVPELDEQACPENGFLFSKIRLNDKILQATNIFFISSYCWSLLLLF